jgi:hypothetical protein
MNLKKEFPESLSCEFVEDEIKTVKRALGRKE